jgi:hypothetical protein
MITNGSDKNLPFLAQFAENLPQVTCSRLRYDCTRQISQVFVNGEWLDTPDARGEFMVGTRKTAVESETTDDE